MLNVDKKIIAVAGFLLAFGVHAESYVSEQEDYTARYQSTYNWQWHPSFQNGMGSTPKSISPAAERMYTFSATAHWGMRAWEGAELYINPEVASGIPFSHDLVGLGGFTNEIGRAHV